MIGRIVTALLACGVAACTGQHTPPLKGANCTAFGNAWQLEVTFGLDGSPVGVVAGSENPRPIPDPERLEVKECDTVQFTVPKRWGIFNRSAMVSFDKVHPFLSPGQQPAYLSRRGPIVFSIDDREGTGKEEFEYSIHVDCPENIVCPPIDPKIVVER